MDEVPLYNWGEARYMYGPCHMCDASKVPRFRKTLRLRGVSYALLLCRKCVEWSDERLRQQDPGLDELISELSSRFGRGKKRSTS